MPLQYEKYTESFDETKSPSDPTRHKYHFKVRCKGGCNELKEVTVNGSDLFDYNQGKFIQDAFPYLSTADREFLCMSGICGTCWDKIFSNEEK